MGDLSAEPSMEEILSSIRRIIAEEGDAPAARRPLRAPAPRQEDDDEVLELSERVAGPRPFDPPSASGARPIDAGELSPPIPEEDSRPVPEPRKADEPRAAAPAPAPILSPEAEQATRGQLAALSRLVVKPDPAPAAGDNTLEGLVRDLLRPMLRDWLDANLPAMVEDMVAREIGRITGRG